MISEYQTEQLEAFALIRDYLEHLPGKGRKAMLSMIKEYLQFRQEVDVFLSIYTSEHCNQKCFQNNLSACCSKDGIITFFADVLINALLSTPGELDELAAVLNRDNAGSRCIYLSAEGCRWRMKPINCEFFLCDQAMHEVFVKHPDAKPVWDELEKRKRLFTWPDRPVLFDDLERLAMTAGRSSTLMYYHNSPGLLLIKRQSGIGLSSR